MFALENEVFIKLKSDPILIGLLRVAVAEIATKMGFPGNEIDELKLVINEACANVIKHVYHQQVDQDIEVRFLIGYDSLEIIIKDFGEKSVPSEFKSRPLNEMKEGGLGIYLIKNMMDEVRYDIINPEVGTELHLVKHLKKENQGNG